MKDINQPEVNIGLIGHVDHGKTTLTLKLSGKWTDTHSEELKRGITIRLGYADAIFYKCKCKDTTAYRVKSKCATCKTDAIPLRKVSFVDAPGHESLMATMLSGSTIMDGAILMIAANEECPQPQTREHLMALQISGIKNIVIVQNKIDLVSDDQAKRNYKQIRDFLKETDYAKAEIVPISAQHNVNIDVLIETLETQIPTPKRDPKLDPILFVARSFDINKPGMDLDKISGGVLGGALQQGKLKVGQEIELRPGRMLEEKNQKIYKSITTKITDLKTGGKSVKEIVPGGSVGILTSLDPAIVKSDSLIGNVGGIPGKLPPVWKEFSLKVHLLKRVVGTKTDVEVEPIKVSEPLMLNVNSAATVGVVTSISKEQAKCNLKLAVCADKGTRVTISRRIDNRFRLIGYGLIE